MRTRGKRLCAAAASLATATALAVLLSAGPAAAQADGPRIVNVVIEGNQRVDRDTIVFQMKLREGSVFTAEEANEDFKRIYALGQFENVVIRPEPVEGGVRLRVTVTELPLLGRVELVGAKHLKPDKLLQLISVSEGSPLDRHRLLSAVPIIEDEYRRRGYYFVEATLDTDLLDSEAVARFTISEGPKVRVKSVAFRGNDSINANELQKEIGTTKGLWPFTSGDFSLDTLESDVARLRAYYVSQGFLDAEVGRDFTFDSKNENVSIEFIITEGTRYQVASVSMQGVETLSSGDLAERLALRSDVFYTAADLRADARLIRDAYGRIGYVHAQADPKADFAAEPGRVDIVFRVTEGPKITIGQILPTGNAVTQDKVILRNLGFEPGQIADGKAIEAASGRLMQTQLFTSADLTLVPTDDPNIENVAVHVEEGRTAQFIIGAGVSSNSGLIGNIALVQRNFDATRWPRGWDDPGAFRGAGQTLRLVLEPGTERSEYSIGFTEPALFDRPIRMDASGSYFTRDRDTYDEERLGGQVSVGKNLTRDVYGSIGIRMESIDIADVAADAPRDVFKVEGSSYLSSATVQLVRDKTDNYFVPTTGSRVSVALEQAGALGGDYTFTKILIDGRRYWTVTEDALGRRSVFSLRGRAGFAPGSPPIFERFYAGGQGTIRGFQYRGVGPFEGDEPIGGEFLLLIGGEYQFPIYGKSFSGVVFIDTGTVEENIGLGTYRASAGVGLRFTVDMFGAPVPFALDFGFPFAKDGDDETEVFSFSIAWSF